MSNAPENPPPPGRSWRNIRQEVQPVAMSRRGRRRRQLAWLKAGVLLTLAAAGGWGVHLAVHAWGHDRAALATAVHSDPVREVVLITDGVLTRAWVTAALALPRPSSLMALDLPTLRNRLLAHGQVRVAVLTRKFPDTLVVTLQERTPVARVQAADGAGQPRQLLVARDGVVYDGVSYDRQMVAGLPWLDGIRLVRTAAGFEPVAGMEDVSALLTTAQLQAPHLYREWLIVSLTRLAAADEIVVRSQGGMEAVFSRRRDYFKQLAQLDYVIDRTRETPAAPALLSVNLALDGQVPIRVQEEAPDRAPGVGPGFSHSNSQRKAKRDL
ncbi:MAG: FtsQ-type POTRA domain-containing protein [Opitutaceae bacterium]|nr:FtsQ-type POTRA domain-containing protein [Opitutaceae bacterium]